VHDHDCTWIEEDIQVKEIRPQKILQKRAKRNERSSKGRQCFNNNESNMVPLFSCELLGCIVKDCPISQKKAKKQRQKAKKELKKAMVAIWSNSDTSNSDDNEYQVVNLGMMAKEEHGEEQTECKSSHEVD